VKLTFRCIEEHDFSVASKFEFAVTAPESGKDCPTGTAAIYLDGPERKGVFEAGRTYELEVPLPVPLPLTPEQIEQAAAQAATRAAQEKKNAEEAPRVLGDSSPHSEALGSVQGAGGGDAGLGDAQVQPVSQEGEPQAEASEGLASQR
jgi:hypothetical protein